jgi:hypothetical protein
MKHIVIELVDKTRQMIEYYIKGFENQEPVKVAQLDYLVAGYNSQESKGRTFYDFELKEVTS